MRSVIVDVGSVCHQSDQIIGIGAVAVPVNTVVDNLEVDDRCGHEGTIYASAVHRNVGETTASCAVTVWP